MSEANKNVVREIEAAWDSNQLDRLDSLFAPDFVQHSAFPGAPATLDGAKQAHQASIQTFPDRKTSIEEIVAEGDTVVVRVRMTGTNEGGLPAFNILANGNKVDTQWVSIYRLRDGKVVEHRGIMDLMGLTQQLTATR